MLHQGHDNNMKGDIVFGLKLDEAPEPSIQNIFFLLKSHDFAVFLQSN